MAAAAPFNTEADGKSLRQAHSAASLHASQASWRVAEQSPAEHSARPSSTHAASSPGLGLLGLAWSLLGPRTCPAAVAWLACQAGRAVQRAYRRPAPGRRASKAQIPRCPVACSACMPQLTQLAMGLVLLTVHQRRQEYVHAVHTDMRCLPAAVRSWQARQYVALQQQQEAGGGSSSCRCRMQTRRDQVTWACSQQQRPQQLLHVTCCSMQHDQADTIEACVMAASVAQVREALPAGGSVSLRQ